ncbi:MAG: hypothetical protein SF002_10910 [Alphaproteobacteria bacterium]|nr:hypothetical protein [Alphaproteobacteria bacterium]
MSTVSIAADPTEAADDPAPANALAIDPSIIAGLPEPTTTDDAFEHWLLTDAVATYDAMKADPSRVRSVEQVRAALRAHLDTRRTLKQQPETC